ncbi:retrovirus polyprotein [Ceratocystis lukuohia]|uniref:Retrovirus polyprotein n=1 Tax=Ceratocystis lukuohia TaxID=2019550 RepID=A0ABR4MGE7_9PEZI
MLTGNLLLFEILAGVTFQVHADHHNLVYFPTRQTLSERQRRWSYELSGLGFTPVHRPGTAQVTSEALSRRDQDLHTTPWTIDCNRGYISWQRFYQHITAAIQGKSPGKDPEAWKSPLILVPLHPLQNKNLTPFEAPL